jgi:tetratricopeptide (TPR) repeat protein
MSTVSNAVFLSYASQDAASARRICEAMQSAGLEVWFDQSELRGGDAWDQKIRKQIKECALFVPVISANTQARPEGYFRLEWKLAVDRSHLMADDQAFIVPVVIDDTPQGAARVPEKFQEVQWTRLLLTETPSAFAARVRTLLSGEPAPSSEARGAARVAGGAGSKKAPASIWWTRVVPLAGVAVALAFALRPMWSPSRPVPASTSKAEAPAAAKTAPLSEARQLIARARALSLDKYSSTPDDFAAAEVLIKQALQADGADAEVYAVSSLFNISIGTRGFDHSSGRKETARSHAERALSLNPNSIESLYALARWQRDNEPDAAVAEATFKQVLERAPEHNGALLTLAIHYMRRNRFDDALPLFERAVQRPALKPLALYNLFLGHFGRWKFADAERCIRDSIAAEPSVNSQCGLAMWLMSVKGDPHAAAGALSAGPAALRSEHRNIWITAYVHLARRAPEDALRALQRLSDDFLQDNWFVGPKAYWVGRAHAMAGRTEAARVAWEAGVEVLKARLARTPDAVDLRLMLGEHLALLGRENEAVREAKVVEEMQRQSSRIVWVETPARIYAALGRAADALRFMPTADISIQDEIGWPLTAALLRIDPLWDRIRDDPAFQQRLVKAAAAEAVKSVTAFAWPRDPELKRAMDLVNGTDANLEDYSFAEDIVKARLALNPMDGETITVMARVQVAFLYRGFDRSDERRAIAKRHAERAVQLAPNDPEALAALGIFYYVRNADLARARELLERAIALKPADPVFHRFRDNALFSDLKVPAAEALASTERTAALFPRDALTHYELARHYRDIGRIADMERALDRTIALAPIPNAVMWKSRIALWVRGDPQEMRKLIDGVPSRTRSVERVVLNRWVHAMVSHQPHEGLEALENLTSNWVEDFDYTGPKALLTATLYELQGKPEIARLQYDAALRDVRQQQVRAPTDPALRGLEAWILHGLGQDNEARPLNRTALERTPRPYRYATLSDWWFTPIPRSLLIGERSVALQLIREAVYPVAAGAATSVNREGRAGAYESPGGGTAEATPNRRVAVESISPQGLAVAPSEAEARAAFRLRFKLDPRMAPFRDDPEIAALLAEPAR